MSDLTLCPGGDCPLRQRCYRFRAQVLGRQDFFGRPPYDRTTSTCEYFDDLALRAPTEDDVRRRAHQLWLSEGRPDGRAAEHWHRARRELEQRLAGQLRPE